MCKRWILSVLKIPIYFITFLFGMEHQVLISMDSNSGENSHNYKAGEQNIFKGQITPSPIEASG